MVVSALSIYEEEIVLFRKTGSADRAADVRELIRPLKVQGLPLDLAAAQSAAAAYAKYGKGLHPAGLNLGDCPAYALAKSMGLPLLFKGDDFAQTDVIPAV